MIVPIRGPPAHVESEGYNTRHGGKKILELEGGKSCGQTGE